jgi:hypothetical protein
MKQHETMCHRYLHYEMAENKPARRCAGRGWESCFNPLPTCIMQVKA